VDGFKRFNDLYGHLAGDHCLVQIAQSLSCTLRRPADLVARYGGEEFAIILPNTAQSGAITVAIAIQDNIKALRIPHSNLPTSNHVTVSLGIATTIPQREASPKTLIEAADQALYQAKRQGRDRYCCFNLGSQIN
jgi:diguanylate cyclase (GGDEF)-like protein